MRTLLLLTYGAGEVDTNAVLVRFYQESEH